MWWVLLKLNDTQAPVWMSIQEGLLQSSTYIIFFPVSGERSPARVGASVIFYLRFAEKKKPVLKSLWVFGFADAFYCHISIWNDFMHKWNAENTLCTQIIQWNPILMGSQIWYQPYSAVQLRRLEGITSFWRNQLARWVIFHHIRIAGLPA